MNCCLFGKSSPPRKRRHPVQRFPNPRTVEPSEISVQCGRCRAPQLIPEKAVVMVCSACRCVNRVIYNTATRERRMSFIDCDIGDSQLVENTPAVFQLGDNSDGKSIPICSVCLDGVGDMVLDHCGHGGICEDCARHIALNRAVGGAHCPLDKQDITQLLRIGELHPEFVKVRVVELPEPANKDPPKVPPPVGLRKGKRANDDSKSQDDKPTRPGNQ